jgi:hypothetical protein
MSMEPFWFVWNPRGRAPTYAHTTRQSAVTEAERLARANPGQPFVVLQAIGEVCVDDLHWQKVQNFNDDIPF